MLLSRILATLCACALLFGAASPARAVPPHQSPDLGSVIEETRQTIPALMEKNGIPGLSIAIVDDQSVLWVEGFGYTHTDRRVAVTADTPFSIQSMSKAFTATAVMMAVQDGLVELDAPITEYLPDFTVNSIFEEHPERKITLRHLLSHTAGFMHEAPTGGNYDLPGRHTLDDHFASISDTWLRFPVGSHWAYSNLGIDLAGYILQVRSGKPFPQYMKEKVFEPLGMVNSSCDFAEIGARADRATGHNGSSVKPPVTMLLVPSGGVYTSASDLARFIRFQINRGELDGRRILRETLVEEMLTPAFQPSIEEKYGLGVGVSQRNGARRIQHGGGGFGFLSEMAWYPELKIGFLVLTNSTNHNQHVALEERLDNRIIVGNLGFYVARAKESLGAANQPAAPRPSGPEPLSGTALRLLIESHALPDDEAAIRRRQGYAGDYHALTQGFPFMDGKLWLKDGQQLYMNNHPLTEVEPGFFFDDEGDFVDLRPGRMSYRNIRIVKRDPVQGMVKSVLFVLCTVAFLEAVILRPGRALARRLRGKKQSGAPGGLVWAAALSAAGALGGLLTVAGILLEPRLIWAPWPVPYPELDWYFSALMLLPYLGLLMALAVAALLARSWKARSPDWPFLAASAAALAVFNLVLLI